MAKLDEIGDLLERIVMHYPAAAKGIVNPQTGNIRKDVAEEWLRIIGFLDYDELLARLDLYMDSDDNRRRPPMAVDFKKFRSRRAANYTPMHTFDRIDSKGQLTDAEGRLYAFPDRPLEKYHWRNGKIVDSAGREVT